MASSIPLLETIQITLSPTGVAELAFNRPNKYNALNAQTYSDWLAAIQWAAKCESVKVVVLTGRGKFYTAGQELVEPDISEAGKATVAKRREVTKGVVDAMIDFPKLLIAGVNGTAYGFGVTTLALCDVVYSVPDALYCTPFMKLAFCAEGCSSYLFPRIMGTSKANEMLLMGRIIPADELVDCGFISRTLPKENFQQRVLELAEEAAQFSSEAIRVTKDLVRGQEERALLHTVNNNEMDRLTVLVSSKDSYDGIMKFVNEAKRKKAAKLAKQQNKL